MVKTSVMNITKIFDESSPPKQGKQPTREQVKIVKIVK
jgi:hypothetical protein